MARKPAKSQRQLGTGDLLGGLAELVGQVVEAVGEAQALHADGHEVVPARGQLGLVEQELRLLHGVESTPPRLLATALDRLLPLFGVSE